MFIKTKKLVDKIMKETISITEKPLRKTLRAQHGYFTFLIVSK